jgi:hypothetical protein
MPIFFSYLVFFFLSLFLFERGFFSFSFFWVAMRRLLKTKNEWRRGGRLSIIEKGKKKISEQKREVSTL